MIKRFIPKNIFLQIIFLTVLACASACISVILPGFYQKIIDFGFLKQDIKLVLKLIAVILGLTILKEGISFINTIKISGIGINIAKQLKKEVVHKVFHSTMVLFDSVGNGELSQRIRETDLISSIFTPQLLNIFISVLACVFAIIKVININYKFILVFVIAFPLLAYASVKLNMKYRKLTQTVVGLNTQSSNLVYECIAGMNEIKSYNLLMSKQLEINRINNDIYEKNKKQNIVYASLSSCLSLIHLLVSVIIILVFSKLIIGNEVSIGQYVELSQYTSLILAPAHVMSNLIMTLQPVGVLMKRLNFFDNARQQDDETGIHIDRITKIEYQNVSFSYGKKMVFQKLNFEVTQNDKILVYGANGSGKTTLIKLLLRLYEDYEGNILINDTDVRELSIHSLREQISVVFQDTFLFDGTLFDNIICGNNKLQKQDVIDALRSSGFINNDNLDKAEDILQIKIMEGGKNLSGGQKRMIAISRALIKQPSVIVLDEPTTFLDAQAQEKILEFIQNVTDKIVIIVTHDQYLQNIIKKRIDL